MRVTLVADWLTTLGGAERTLAEFHALWPQFPIVTTVADPQNLGALERAAIRTTRLQRLFRTIGRHQPLLPLMPRALEDMDVRGTDVILSSSHAVAKGIIPPGNAVHVCYCHTPMRYAWEMEEEYLRDFGVPRFLLASAKHQLRALRRWDLSTAKRVDVFLANSTETAKRITRIYGREATVIPPPVHERFFAPPLHGRDERTTFLAVGRLVPYKRFDLLIGLANADGFPLTIVGKGQEARHLRSIAGPTVRFHGRATEEELPHLYGSARALLFPTHEDAGIVPLEAQACGTPVIAFGKGGILDTVIPGATGIFFSEQTVDGLRRALRKYDSWSFDPEAIREHARRFSAEGFRTKIKGEVERAWQQYGHPSTHQ